MPLRKVHELAFLWFGLPGPLQIGHARVETRCSLSIGKQHFAAFENARVPKNCLEAVVYIGHGEVRVYRGTGVSCRVRRTAWERSLRHWELQIPCFEAIFWGGNTLGLVPASLPHTL